MDVSQVEDRVAARLPGWLVGPWRLTSRTVVGTVDDRVTGLAAEAAFFTLLSLPPLLLAVVGGFGWISDLLGPEGEQVIARLQSTMEQVMSQVLTADSVAVVVEQVDRIASEGRPGLFSAGLAIAFWSASRATNTFIAAITIAYDIEDPRPAWKRRLLALGLTLAGALVGFVIFPALVLGPDLVAYLAPDPLDVAVSRLVEIAFWPAVAVVTVGLLSALYDIGVPWSTPLWRDLPGAVLAMSLWLVGSALLRYYVEVTIQDSDTVQGFAAPLVAMLWLYVTAFAVLLGAELNAEIERLWPHAGEGSGA